MTKIFIYGSCTTRDSVEFWPENLELQGYVARQSLVSTAAGGSTAGFNLQRIKSTFQKRMIKHDLNGAATEQIQEAIESGAYVVWDLTDERNGFVELVDGRICSVVAINHKELRCSVESRKITKMVDPDFLQEWKKAADYLSEVLGEKKKKVLVNHTPWAENFENGDPVPHSEVPTPIFNELLKEMTGYLEGLGFSLVELKSDEVKSSLDHKWGPAPFHYHDETYRIMISRIKAVIDAKESS